MEYSGKWKQLHYHAKRFYAPIIVSAFQTKTDDVEVWVTNDQPSAAEVSVTAQLMGFDGAVIATEVLTATVAAGAAHMLIRRALTTLAATEADRGTRFWQLSLTGTAGGQSFAHVNTQVFTEYKRCTIFPAEVTTAINGFQVTLTTDRPALFVQVNADGLAGEFDDNSLTLLPGQPRTLTFTPKGSITAAAFAQAISVLHLRATY